MNRAVLIISSILLLLAGWTVMASWITLYGLGTLDQVSIPTWHWWAYYRTAMPDFPTQQFVNRWLWIGGVGAGVPVFLVLHYLSTHGRKLIGLEGQALYGTSKFATRKQGEKSGLIYSRTPRPDCILLGKTRSRFGFWRYVCLVGVEHVMLFAKTGSGKGVSYVITNCFNYADSLVVLDIKFENHKTTAFHRHENLGQEVYLFAPLAENGQTHCWNPLGHISTDDSDYVSKLQSKSFDFFPEVDGKEKFWQNGARSAFHGISVLVAETPDLELNPITVFRFFTRGDGKDELIRLIEEARSSGNPYSQVCVDLVSDYLTGTDEVVNGIRKHVTSTMGLWFNPKIAAVTAKSDFNLRDLRRKKMTIYIGVMPSELEQIGVLLRLFFLQLFESNTDSMPDMDETISHRCHVMWDEFTAIPAMRAIAKATGFARGFWLQFSFIVQTKNQVREEYKGHSASSLLENLGAEIVFGTDDHTLCKEASERSGDNTVHRISRSQPRFLSFLRTKEQNENISDTKRPLLLPQEVSRLPPDEQIMFRASIPPLLLNRLCWFKDKNFRDLAGEPPEAPTVTYTLDRDDGSIRFGID